MGLLVTPTEDDTFTVLRSFLLQILPDGIEVIQSQDNKVPEPVGNDFVLMTPRSRRRLSTNVDKWLDTAFSGHILDNILTVTAIALGRIAVPAQLFSPSFQTGLVVMVTSQIDGAPGGIGHYQLVVTNPGAGIGNYVINQSPIEGDPNPDTNSEIGLFVIGGSPIEGTTFAAGGGSYLQPTEFTVQLDVHGDAGADYSQIITTMFRDEFAFDFFVSLNENVTPLYASDPLQLPFSNAEQQVENRWVIEAMIQVNATVSAPQQFASTVNVGLINVDVVYPPH